MMREVGFSFRLVSDKNNARIVFNKQEEE